MYSFTKDLNVLKELSETDTKQYISKPEAESSKEETTAEVREVISIKQAGLPQPEVVVLVSLASPILTILSYKSQFRNTHKM